ncbi:MAG: MXAN_2562 family outer membrane beta-barrel protein [Myxococcota bacterium]
MIRSNKTYWLGLAALLLTLTFSASASAQTPTHGKFELRFGGYYPSVDEEDGLSGAPFERAFGAKDHLMFELNVGYHFFDRFGNVGAAASVGYSNFKGDAELSDTSEEFTSEQSPTTAMTIIPMRGEVYYHFDWLVDEYNIPFALLAKAGLDLHYWRIKDGNSSTAEEDGEKATGFRPGWHAGAQAQLWLDWIDQESSASFDLNWGINNTYLFAEYLITRANGFGTDGFQLNDNQWMFGLAFEY